MNALAEPPDDPVRPGGVEHIGELVCPLALEVVQMPLTGLDLVGPAQPGEGDGGFAAARVWVCLRACAGPRAPART